MARAACGRLALGVGLRSIAIKDCPKNTNVLRVEEDIPEILFIGNHCQGAVEGWKKMPMKVSLGNFDKDRPRLPIQTTQIGQTGVVKNRVKVLEVDDAEGEEEEEVMNVGQVENSEDAASGACGFEGSNSKERVQFLNSVNKEEGLGESWRRRQHRGLGGGRIVLASGAGRA